MAALGIYILLSVLGGLLLIGIIMGSTYDERERIGKYWPLFTFAFPLGCVVMVVKAAKLTCVALEWAWKS